MANHLEDQEQLETPAVVTEGKPLEENATDQPPEANGGKAEEPAEAKPANTAENRPAGEGRPP
ncbi:MAG: hypothetical protein ACRD4G_16145, partial [Bryobacteraceae bacterium]